MSNHQTLTAAVIDAQVDAFAAELATLPDLPTTTPPVPLGPTGVPVLTGLQAEGDVLVTPTRRALPHWAQPLPHDHPVTLIGEGNGHVLRALTRGTGQVLWAPVDGDPNVIALVDIHAGPDGTDAVLLVEQPGGGHHPLALGPGRYEIRRQRERLTPTRTRRPLTRPAARRVSAWVAD